MRDPSRCALAQTTKAGQHMQRQAQGRSRLETEEAQRSCSSAAVVLSRQASHLHLLAHLFVHVLA